MTLNYKIGDLLREYKSPTLSAQREGEIVRIFNELGDREEVYRAFLDQQKIIKRSFLNLPFEIIFSEVLAVNNASFEIDIPQQYTHLVIFAHGRTDYTGTPTKSDGLSVRFNGDTGSNYEVAIVYSENDGSPTVETYYGTQSFINLVFLATDNAPANSSNGGVSFIPNYTAPFFKETLRLSGGLDFQSTDNPNVSTQTAWWKSTEAIKKMLCYAGSGGNIKAGSALSIYGIK